MTEPLAVAALKAAEVLAPDLVKAGVRGLGREKHCYPAH